MSRVAKKFVAWGAPLAALLALGINVYRAHAERVSVRVVSPQPPPATAP